MRFGGEQVVLSRAKDAAAVECRMLALDDLPQSEVAHVSRTPDP
jgi:hypothetical protein